MNSVMLVLIMACTPAFLLLPWQSFADDAATDTQVFAKASSTLPSTGTVSQVNSTENMIFIKGGCFKMGRTFTNNIENDDTPAHTVCVDDFYIGKYEIKQRQWIELMGNNLSTYKCENCPMHDISWEDAEQFINKLNHRTGKRYRLPTEAEWEYAARSGGKDETWAGTSDEAKLEEYVWQWRDGDKIITTVSTRKPNGLGLYDMTGSVWEWIEDWYGKDYYKDSPKDNPKGPRSGQYRVLRGGSWLDDPMYAPTYQRHFMPPYGRGASILIGFRLVTSAK